MQFGQLQDPVAPRGELLRRYAAAVDGCRARQTNAGSELPSTSR
jgi:hypothetical protein